VIRVVVADDNAVIRQGLVSLLEVGDAVTVVAEAANGEEAIAAVEAHRPDVVLLDVRMPKRDGIAAAEVLSDHVPVLMLTYAEDDATITAALRAGASGYLVHGRFGPDELVAAVAEVAGGGVVIAGPAARVAAAALRGGRRRPGGRLGLSDREAELMALLALGRTNADLAAALCISEKTVKNHLTRIYTHLGVRNRGEAVARWLAADQEATHA
jgi:DNA-binding NarL/FixJ family response regulator